MTHQYMELKLEELEKRIEALEQEPCDDAISRQAVLAAMRKNHRSGGRDIDGDYIEGDYKESLYDDIISLPSATSQPKTGRWISLDDFRGKYNENGFMCSECGEHSDFEENFCPNCGCRMVELQESEE